MAPPRKDLNMTDDEAKAARAENIEKATDFLNKARNLQKTAGETAVADEIKALARRTMDL